ncbi:hypothetical protein WR25_04910 [Diploscapter pachys]|uniref:Uncharacterized protein n=1 Tax=Diploscapter pachys TaxID=2018661 RepID=A0A2A2JIA7_9BILA|nr:hypothetical protein WR25_04910 [Diploscapter pachys]
MDRLNANKIPPNARFGPGPVIPNSNQYGNQNGFQQYNAQLQPGQTGMSYPQLQRDASSSRSIVINSPMRLDTQNSGVNGAQVDFKLNSYSNPTFSLSNTTTCRCPISNCNYLSENCQNSCMFSFVTVISSYDQSVQYIQSDFYPFPSGAINAGNWTQQYTFYMLSRPVAVDVFVQHLGVVIDRTTAQLLYYNHLTLVDTFVVDMYAFNNNPNNVGGQALTLTGQQLGTQLSLQLNVQCINNMMGPMCDLVCNTNSVINGNTIICYNNHTNVYWACQYDNYRSLATNCNVCSNGVFNGTCNNGYFVNQLGGVAYAFRTWTIVLGVLLGIALLLLLCLILSYLICYTRNRNKNETTVVSETESQSSGRNNYAYKNGRKSEYERQQQQKLLDDEYYKWQEEQNRKKVVPVSPTNGQYEEHRQTQQPDKESEYSDRGGGTYHQHVTHTVTRTSREHQV